MKGKVCKANCVGPKNCSTRENILNVSARMFAKFGYAGSSISKIAKEVGIGKSGIYAHFNSKEEILDELIKKYGPESAITVLGGIEEEELLKNPKKVLKDAVEKLIEFWSSEEARIAIMFLLKEIAPNDKINLKALIQQIRSQLTNLFKVLIKAKILKNDFPVELFLFELMTPMVFMRIYYLGIDASEEDIQTAKFLAQKHIEYFIDRNFQ